MTQYKGCLPRCRKPQLPLGIECFLAIAGCRVLERSLRLLPEGLHYFRCPTTLLHINHQYSKYCIVFKIVQ
jgi:hypothetical protein